jgi:hypothetical protein
VIGNEGVVGLASLLAETTAFRTVVQLPGFAYKLSRDLLRKEFKRCEALQRILLHYTKRSSHSDSSNRRVQHISLCRGALLQMAVDGSRPLCSRPRAVDPGSPRSHSRKQKSFRFRNGKRIPEARRNSLQQRCNPLLDRKHLERASCECYETISAAHSRIDS